MIKVDPTEWLKISEITEDGETYCPGYDNRVALSECFHDLQNAFDFDRLYGHGRDELTGFGEAQADTQRDVFDYLKFDLPPE